MGETTETEKRECLQTSFSCFLTLKNNHVCVNNPQVRHHRGFCLWVGDFYNTTQINRLWRNVRACSGTSVEE